MLTIKTSRDRLQNNTMIIIYHNRETTFLNTLATVLNKNNDLQAVMFLNRFRSLFAEVLPIVT